MGFASKNFSVYGVRGSLLGDMVCATPIYAFIEKKYPGSYRFWNIARKCSVALPLLANHPLIDQIVVSDCEEGMGPRDHAIAATCDLFFDPMPGHPDGDGWPNFRRMEHEVFRMSGLTDADYATLTEEEKRPTLARWFPVERRKGTIAIWPCAGYGRENKRNPSKAWYEALVEELWKRGYMVCQYGHPNDFTIQGAVDCRSLAFFDQIKATVGCDLVISTDSGSGLIAGAYQLPQITLLTAHWPGHVQNPYAFSPNNPNNVNFFAPGSADGISRDAVLAQVEIMMGGVAR